MCLDRVMWDKIFGLGENGENWTNNAALHRFLVAKSDCLNIMQHLSEKRVVFLLMYSTLFTFIAAFKCYLYTGPNPTSTMTYVRGLSIISIVILV